MHRCGHCRDSARSLAQDVFIVAEEADVVDRIRIVTRGNFASGYAVTHDIIGAEPVGLEAQERSSAAYLGPL